MDPYVDEKHIPLTSKVEKSVKVRLNHKEHIEVNRQKLLKSSSYFQKILSSSFKDHKSEFVEVNSSVIYETFERVMQFVNTGDIDLSNDNVFDTFELADYLQISKLKICCLDQFSSSLDRENVQTKFNLLKDLDFPVDEFTQRALRFVNKLTGLYFMQCETNSLNKSHLKFFSEENNPFRTISCHSHDESVELNLHVFSNTLVMCPSTDSDYSTEPNMIMYDLITGKTEETKLRFEGPAVNCSNEKNLFVISAAEENSGKKVFCIERRDFTNFHSTKNTIEYSSIENYIFSLFHFAKYNLGLTLFY